MNIQAPLFFIGVLLLIVFFYTYWKTLCIDWARQLLFEERAQLVRLVLDGKLSFDSPVYRTSRRLIEVNIRYLHVLTWPRLLLWSALRRQYKFRHVEKEAAEFRKQFGAISDSGLRSALKAIYLRACFASVVCLMGRSIILGPLFLALYFGRWLTDKTDNESCRTIYTTVTLSAAEFEQASVC